MPDTITIQPAPLVKQLDRKHADYLLYKDEWEHLDLLYAGGVRLKVQGTDFLIKRPKELFDVYQERYRRLTYQNLLANCIGWYISKLFAVEPKIDGKTTDARFASFLQDSDRSGTTFMDFSRSVLETMMLYRRAFVLIDKPQPGDQPIFTRADEQAQGLDQPYVVLYDPRQVFNWALDAYGNVNWIVIKTLEIEQDDPMGEVHQSAHWYVFDKRTFRHYRYVNQKPENVSASTFFGSSDPDKAGDDARAELVDEGAHALADAGRVPIRVCELPDSLWFSNRSYLHLLEHVDTQNGYSWKLFMANHPQLVIHHESDDLGGITRSEVGYIRLQPDDKIMYLEPNGDSFKESRAYLDMLRQEIYRGFHLQAQGKDSSASADGASGYSKEMEMAPAIDMLNAIGAKLRSSQQLILLDYKTAAKMPVTTPEQQPDVNGYRFENKPILQDIDIAQALVDTGVVDKSPTLEQVVDKHIALSVSGGENEETKAQIIKELEAAPTRKETRDLAEQQAQQAFETKFQKAGATATIKNIEGSDA
jgi:hypothetical protein